MFDISQYGTGKRRPQDPFFAAGNAHIPFLKTYGVIETDVEELLHAPTTEFPCSVPTCPEKFDSVFGFEQHYNTSHRYICGECHKILQTPHLLDLHLSETHDSYFAVQTEKKPMFRCFIEECNLKFMNAELRKKHTIDDHKFPSCFPFEGQKKSQRNLKKKHDEQGEESKMNTDKVKKQKPPKLLGPRSNGRIRILTTFTKDLSESLPT